MNLYISLLIILMLIYFYITNSNNEYNSECKEYKIIKEKKENNICDTFNIKEFDIINDNVIIHNKFKTELLDHNFNKYNKELKELELKDINDKKIKQDIIINSKYVQLEDLNKTNKQIIQDIKYLRNNLKKEINDFMHDYKNKIATKKDALMIISNLNKEINDINKYIINIDTKFKKYPLEKINLLNKKIRLYTNIISKY